MEVKRRKLPIGVSDFKRIIEDNNYYIDKSLLIKEIIDDGSSIILLPRPRRFGKTLNIMMLKYFFEKTNEDHSTLFHQLAIWKQQEYHQYQGQYPVIYITFKDEKHDNWETAVTSMYNLLAKSYRYHDYLLQSDVLTDDEKKQFRKITGLDANNATYQSSLNNLSEYLYRYHKKKVIILIDEYDVPIQSGWMNNYYKQIMSFLRNFFSGGLKDNIFIEKAVLTGIMRIAKESIFSGLNNLNVCTILNNQYSDKFGLLESEVEKLLSDYHIIVKIDAVKEWYNGYTCGKNIIYNPWSIINYASKWDEGFRAYWVNTSSNDLVQKLITEGGSELKAELEQLIQGKEIIKEVNDDIVFNEIEKNAETVWSFLLFCGYLKATSKHQDEMGLSCTLAIPNKEVAYLYRTIILAWFKEKLSSDHFNLMLTSLTNGDIRTFSKILQDFVLNSVSYFDIGGREPEKVYHAFVLGMLVALSPTYEVKSNRESGYGRYDVMVIPRDLTQNGIIIEFKKVDKYDKETLETAVEAALEQITVKNYRQELIRRGIMNIIELGIAFDGKELLVRRQKSY